MNRILHIGLGSFHRAHQAVYLNQLHKLGDKSWVLAGGNIRADMADTIAWEVDSTMITYPVDSTER